MVFYPMSRIQQNRHEITTYRSLSQQYFNLDEAEFMIAPYYSKEPKFITIRSIALPYIEKFTCDQTDTMVGYLALNFFDHFLSRNGDIPVVLHGFGFERNLELFVFCCVSIAFKSRFGEYYLFTDFWNTRGRMEKEDNILIMEREILKGLNKKVRRRPLTAIILSYILQHKLEKEHPEQVFPNGPRILVSRLLVEIQKDIRFTEFGLSTLAAAAILVTSYRVQPDMYSKFKHSIYSFGFVEKMEVKACLDELKTHYIVDYMLNPKRQAEEWKEMSGMGVGKLKGKMDGNELLIDRYSLMERVLICLWPLCNCFGIHFGSFRD